MIQTHGMERLSLKAFSMKQALHAMTPPSMPCFNAGIRRRHFAVPDTFKTVFSQ
jgi:hypothetical protein